MEVLVLARRAAVVVDCVSNSVAVGAELHARKRQKQLRKAVGSPSLHLVLLSSELGGWAVEADENKT
jgi:hypothetical protein